MLFHVTITHSQADCPGRRPAETPALIGPADRLEALGDELSVTSHSVVWGAACILWAAPEHVAYVLLEAPSLEAADRYIDALTPAGWATRALPVFTLPAQLEAVRQLLSQPAMPHMQPSVAVAEPAEPAVEAEPVKEADSADTLKEVTIAPPPDTAYEPRAEPPDRQVTPTIPTPALEPQLAPTAEPHHEQITRPILTPVFEAAPATVEPEQDEQITRALPTPIFEEPASAAAERAEDQQITRALPTPIFEEPRTERPDLEVTREIPRPVEQPAAPADRGSGAVTRFIERPAVLESLAASTPPADEPEPPASSVTPTDTGPIPFSESSTVILDPATLPMAGLQLVAKTGPAQGSVFEVGEAGATLGRLPDNSICLTDGRLSRHHAQIEFRDGDYWLTDLGSQNGTLLNDRPLTEARRLREGDLIELGTTRLTVMLESDN
jgi:hypothetical protein